MSGLKYDRLELKFITDRMIKGRSEAEMRVAAFRHAYGTQFKECISASSVMTIHGPSDGSRSIGIGKIRWIHGVQFGWDYTDADDAIYTIELQHRNPDSVPMKGDPGRQLYAFSKLTTENESTGIGDWRPMNISNDSSNSYRMLAERRAQGSSNWTANSGWYQIDIPWDGSYNISNMHYCVGLPQERLPDATTAGWFWYSGGTFDITRPGDIAEPYYRS
ncbi:MULTISPECIES: hypothetical protein [unclassified Streptomyces]|uniref:hypothetical protein n=1 Tax=Streptomyces sp. NPDC056835 TaxID=3345956 RepID=UPI0036CFB35F